MYKTEKDKVYHLIISALLTVLFSFILGFEMAVAVTIGIGIGWELFWKVKKNNPFSWRDVIADGSGIVIGLVIFSLIKVVM
ncbi:MAG: hypothetical protein WC175_00995 [Candidatus Dojkabacteria bacterium]